MKRNISWWILLVLAVAGISCAGQRKELAGTPPESSTALLVDETLASKIILKEQTGQRDPATGAFVTRTQITNQTFEWFELECRTLFKNAAGTTLETSPWKRIVLDPASSAAYSAPSLKPDATRFIIQIRLAKKPSK